MAGAAPNVFTIEQLENMLAGDAPFDDQWKAQEDFNRSFMQQQMQRCAGHWKICKAGFASERYAMVYLIVKDIHMCASF